MIPLSLHWNERGTDDLALWPFAVRHAIWLYNRLPNRYSGLSPLELLHKHIGDHRDLLRTHVWGCPVFVLDPKLQDGKKVPKWNRRARQGQFLGFSDEHSSLVANVRHLETGHVSPQYHLVFDDHFHTVFGDGEECEFTKAICDLLWENNREVYAEDEFDASGELIYTPPPLDDIWHNEEGRRERKVRLREQRRRMERQIRLRTEQTHDSLAKDASSPDPELPDLAEISDDDAASSDSSAAPPSESEGDGWDDHPIFDANPGAEAPVEPDSGPILVPTDDTSEAPTPPSISLI